MQDFLIPQLLDANQIFSKGIIYLEDFEGVLNWTDSGDGADYVVDLHADAALNGSKGLRMQTRATSPTDGDSVVAGIKLHYPEQKLIVCRFRFKSPDISKVDHLIAELNFYDTSKRYQAQFYIDLNTPSFLFTDDVAGNTAITDLQKKSVDNAWNSLEFAIDLNDTEYRHVIFNGLKHEFSSNNLEDKGAATQRYSWLQFEVVAEGNNQATMYFDNLIISELLNL